MLYAVSLVVIVAVVIVVVAGWLIKVWDDKKTFRARARGRGGTQRASGIETQAARQKGERARERAEWLRLAKVKETGLQRRRGYERGIEREGEWKGKSERERERGRVEGGWGTNECEKWKVASRVKYNTCLSVCVLCLVVHRSGLQWDWCCCWWWLTGLCGSLWACQGHCELTCLMLVHLSDLEGCCALNVNWLKFGQTALQWDPRHGCKKRERERTN